MAIPVWPSELPQKFVQDGYGRGFGDGRQFVAMGQGPAKTRRRYSAVVKPVSGLFMASADQLARLERFWDEETDGGALPFLIIDAVFHGAPLLTDTGDILTNEDGVPLLIESWWIAMFGESAPEATAVSHDHYRISVQLNVMP